ncbi:MAG: AzlC family ABC transporter permease [Lachnospiraceae bacterium]|nr:AzlC family ABC transporter permease [Lachnospiraceae bacterium]
MRSLKAAFPQTIPVMTGYVFLGLTYGILMVTRGFPFYLPVLTAAIIYTGSMEFLLADILLTSFHPASVFVTALMVGARHLFYGISMLDKYRDMGWKKFYLIYTTSDETFAVNYSADIPEGVDRSWFYFWVSLLDQSYWIIGCLLGGLFGQLLTFNTEGLDFVMTAMFVAIFMNQWMKESDESGSFWKGHVSAFVGILASVITLIIFGPDNFIIPAMIVIFAVLTLLRGKLDPAYNQKGEEK